MNIYIHIYTYTNVHRARNFWEYTDLGKCALCTYIYTYVCIHGVLKCVGSVLKCVAASCSVLQCVAVCCCPIHKCQMLIAR